MTAYRCVLDESSDSILVETSILHCVCHVFILSHLDYFTKNYHY